MSNVESIPTRLKIASYATINRDMLTDVPDIEQLLMDYLHKSYDKALQDIPLGFYAEPATVGFYEADGRPWMVRIVKQGVLKRVRNLGALLFDIKQQR